MNLSFFCLLLWICVHVVDVRAEEEGFEPECMDRLSNCPDLALQGFCQTNKTNDEVAECALSCGLCARKIMLFDRIVRSRSRPVSRPVARPAARSRPVSRPVARPAARSRPVSRPAARSRPVARPAARSRPAPVRSRPTNTRAARPKVRQVRPRARQARPKPRATRPKVRQVRPKSKPAKTRTKSTNSRSRPSSPRRRPNPRARTPPRTRAQPRKQPATRELGRGTVEGSFPQTPLGTGIIQNPPDAMPLSELAETKTSYLRMSGKMASMNVYAGRIVGAVTQAATWIENQVSSYVLGRYVVSSYDMIQSRVKRSEKNWVTKIKEAASDAASLAQQTNDVKAEMEKIMSRMQKHMDYFKDRANIASSLKSFSTDFGRSLEVVKKIEVTLLPAKNTLTVIVQTVDTVQGNDEMKKLAEKLRENAKTFQTVGDETKALDEEIKKIGKDFQNNVDSISTHKGDMQIVREPENPQAFEPKKEEPKKEPETTDNDPTTTAPAPANGNDSNPPNNNNNQPPQNNNNPPSQNNNNNNQPPQNNNPPPDEGPVITLRCEVNRKFIAEFNNNGENQMACAQSGNNAQKFHLIKQADNKYALKTNGTNKFCTGGDNLVKCDKTSVGDSEKFVKTDDNTDKTFVLQCSNNKFLGADANANNGHLACSKAQSDATKFAVFDESGSAQQNPSQPANNNPQQNNPSQPVQQQPDQQQNNPPSQPVQQQPAQQPDPQQNNPPQNTDDSTPSIKIKCDNNKFFASKTGNAGDPIGCLGSNSLSAENYQLIKQSDGKIALKAVSIKQFCSLDGENVKCTKNVVGDTEKFDKIDNADKTFSLKCQNGRFLTRLNANQDILSCSSGTNTVAIHKFSAVGETNGDENTPGNPPGNRPGRLGGDPQTNPQEPANTPDQQPTNSDGSSFSLKCANGNYMKTIDNSDKLVGCVETDLNNADIYQFVKKPDGKYNLKMPNRSGFCNADHNKLSCINYGSSALETFEKRDLPNKGIALKCSKGKWLTNTQDPNKGVKCIGENVEDTQKFILVERNENGAGQPKQQAETDSDATISLQCFNNMFIAGKSGDSRNQLGCSEAQKSTAEKFKLAKTSSGKYTLRTASNNNYCIADSNRMVCSSSQSVAVEYEKSFNGDGTISLKCASGKFLTNRGDADNSIICGSDAVDTAQKFRVVEESGSNQKTAPAQNAGVKFMCSSNKFVTIAPGDTTNRGLVCTGDNENNAEQFQMNQVSGVFVSLQSLNNNRYCTIKEDIIKCKEETATKTEQYEKMDNGDGLISLKCSTGPFIIILPDNKGLKCGGNTLDEAEKFRTVPINSGNGK